MKGEIKMKKKLAIILCSIFVMGAMCGCQWVEEPVTQTTHNDNLDKLEVEYADEETKTSVPSLTQTLDVYGEPFQLKCVYDTGNYPLDSWLITDSKEVTMTVTTENLPEGYEVFIDHVHADISLYGDGGRFNGILQDSMDDTSHCPNQSGFYIDDDTPYKNIFSIEGYNNEFVKIASTYAIGNYYTSVSMDEVRINEKELQNWGVNYEKLMVVYDVTVKAPTDTYYHTVSVSSEMLIPVAKR